MKTKKKLFNLLTILCFGFSTITLASCGDTPTVEPTSEPNSEPTSDTHVHEWDEGQIVNQATCTEAGLMAFVCKTCDETKIDVISAKGHTEVIEEGVEPTCTTTGLTEGKHCSECGEVLATQETIPVAPHVEVIDEAVKQTCTTAGLTEGKHCSECNEVLVEQEEISPAHNFVDYVCSECNSHYYTEGLQFSLLEDGESYSVSGYIGSDTDVIIPSVYADEPVISIGNYAFRDCSSLTSINIPDNVTSIGKGAFDGCSSLTSIKIPDNVTSIGSSAFYNCSSLTSINIPDNVTSIGSYAFGGCSSLESIIVDSENGYYDSRNNCNAIIETSTNTLIAGCKNTIIPNSVTSIGDFAFDGCSSLTSIKIPDNVTSIGKGAFRGCSSLTSIKIPDNVTSIGSSAFYNCSSLKSINIPDNVTKINDSTFQGCSSLTNIIIGIGVTYIGLFAFEDCYLLTDVYYTGTSNQWSWISINLSGDWYIINATKHYNYKEEN